jgi:phospholipid/cholesterol/gamma-HCH transport system permease protein
MSTYRMLDELGSIAYLMWRTIASAATPPYNYGEFADQCRFVLKLCWFPLLVPTVAYDYRWPRRRRHKG